MNTAVPGARIGGSASTLFRNGFNSIASARRLADSSCRPRAHVIISVKIAAAMSSVNQPPENTFRMFDEKNTSSIIRKKPVAPKHSHHG